MSNSTQRKLGYRDVVYNINAKRFFQYEAGDNYKELEVEALGILSGSTADRPSSPNIGDLYWDTNVDGLIVYNGSSWELVGGSGSGSGFWTKSGTDLIPLNTGDDVILGGNKIRLFSTGEAYFVSDVALGTQNPAATKLSINVLTRGTDGIDFTNSGGNNIYAGIKCQASGNALYFENRSAGKTLYIENNGDVKIGGSLPSNPAIHLKSAGGANFDQSVNVGLVDTSSVTAEGILAKASGTVRIQRTDSSIDALSIYNQNVETVSITAGGFAEYAGSMTVNRALANNPAFIARQAGVEKAKIRADGQGLFSGGVSIGGFTAANTIDEYEEGTFTPALTSSSGDDPTQSYTTQFATYVRIGKLVSIKVLVKFATSGITAGSGNMRVNLPFNVSGSPAGAMGIAKGFLADPPVAVQGANNTGFVSLMKNLANDNCSCANIQNNTQLSFSLVYEIA